MMDSFTIASREADLAFLECVNTIDIATANADITFFAEAADSSSDKKEGIGSKIVKKVKELANKIIKFFQDFYNSAKAKLLGERIKKDPKALENKKAEVLDTKKVILFRGKFKKKIEAAKTVEEVDQIVAEYEKKNKAIGAGTAALMVSVPLAVLGTQIATGKLKETGDKLINQLQEESNKANANYCNAAYNGSEVDINAGKSVLDKANDELSKKSKTNKDGQLVAKKGYALQKLIADDMKSVKDWFTSSVSAVTSGLSKTVQKVKDAKKTKEIDEKMDDMKKNGMFGESAEELSFFGEEDLFEESFSDVKEKASVLIQKIIKKIKEFYQALKNKLELAKINSVLKLKAASSTMKIKFALNDKNVTKTVKLFTSAYDKYIVAIKKIELQFTAGKITIDDFNSKVQEAALAYDRELTRIANLSSTEKINVDEHEAKQVRDYLSNLSAYQIKVIDKMNADAEKELVRLQKEAEEAEKTRLANRTTGEKIKDGLSAAKNKIASAISNANKKTVVKIVGIIGLGVLVNKFATKIANSANLDDVFESFDDTLSGIVGEEFTESSDSSDDNIFEGLL